MEQQKHKKCNCQSTFAEVPKGVSKVHWSLDSWAAGVCVLDVLANGGAFDEFLLLLHSSVFRLSDGCTVDCNAIADCIG